MIIDLHRLELLKVAPKRGAGSSNLPEDATFNAEGCIDPSAFFHLAAGILAFPCHRFLLYHGIKHEYLLFFSGSLILQVPNEMRGGRVFPILSIPRC